MKFRKALFIFCLIFSTLNLYAEYQVKTVKFTSKLGMIFNSAGPLLVSCDEARDRVIVANTLSSSLSIIDGKTHVVNNIPIGGRILQHLKADALTINKKNGFIYLIGIKKFFIIDPANDASSTVETEYQFESIAVDENTGNVFLCGRECKKMAFFQAGLGTLKMIDWLEDEKELINENQTPPPAIRKVIAMNDPTNQVIALDGMSSTLHLFDTQTGALVTSRELKLYKNGRWHLAGYNRRMHTLYIVTETSNRKVMQAAKLDVLGDRDIIVDLPGYREGVGICYNPKLDQIYIPYDNHASVHVADFKDGNQLKEIKIPAYGNDASSIDIKNDLLYIGSWAHGEIEIIDLKNQKFVRNIKNAGIIPHMFSMTFNPNNNTLYFPMGATAVNGCFGASIKSINLDNDKIEKIYTGWAPVEMIEMKEQGGVAIFNNEDQFALVKPDGYYDAHTLPYDHPICATASPEGNIYLSYGAHQSYWPTVYIWDAKNGVLTIDKDDLSYYDRRIPAQAMKIALGGDGRLYLEQNNWGRREQFLSILIDEVRYPEIKKRIHLADTVTRETTQRLFKYDKNAKLLYLSRVAEKEGEPGILQIINPDSGKVIKTIKTGVNPCDMIFDEENIYIANFDSKNVSVISKEDYGIKHIETGDNPLKLCMYNDDIFVINHTGNTIIEVDEDSKPVEIPFDGLPDNVFSWKGKLVIASHNSGEFNLSTYNPSNNKFGQIFNAKYPYGETSFNTANSAFYMSGQFGDAIFEITKALTDSKGRLWISDFLSGKVYIIEE